MWKRIANVILEYRITLLGLLVAATLLMGYFGTKVQMSYEVGNIIPADHPQQVAYQDFKQKFGSDGNSLLIGMKAERLFDLEVFNAWYDLGEKLRKLEGVEQIVSVPHAAVLKKDTTNKRFQVLPLVTEKPTAQAEVDSLKKSFFGLPFYEGLVFNSETQTTLMGVSITKEVLNSNKRITAVEAIVNTADQFVADQNITLHYSGMPHLRAFRAKENADDIKITTLLSVLLAGLILLILFRSFKAMIFPLLVVLIGIIWCMGILVLLGYKISLVTALIPPLVVVVSVPDCVYLINHYQRQFMLHGNKKEALKHSISKIGYVLFFANLTTAIGFSVFAFTDSEILQEFGIVAGLTITVLFIAAIIVVPVMLSFYPTPTERHLKHLETKSFSKVLDKLNNWTLFQQKRIQFGAVLVVIFAITGMIQLQARGYIFDDVPKASKNYEDLKFFEQNFNGALPFEVLVDTKKKSGVTKSATLKRIEKAQDIISEDTLFSRPLSLVEGMKFATQAYYNGKEKYYQLPGRFDRNFVLKYLGKTTGDENVSLLNSFTDSTQRVSRISARMYDVGSHEFPAVLDSMKNRIETVLDTSKYDITYTGTSVISFTGYNFLIDGLINSVLLAFILISLVVAYIFKSVRMLLIALLPNMIPLLVTAAIMGYSNIFLKPSTVLIFSIAFGVSVDFTIHFLAKYRLEKYYANGDSTKAVAKAIQETGLSMIYTAIILFFGFIIFVVSNFEGTFYMGILTSITIVVAILTNLILLPALLLSYDK